MTAFLAAFIAAVSFTVGFLSALLLVSGLINEVLIHRENR